MTILFVIIRLAVLPIITSSSLLIPQEPESKNETIPNWDTSSSEWNEFSWNENVRNGSHAHFDNSTASWIFHLRLKLPKRMNYPMKSRPTSLVFKVALETLAASHDDSDAHNWLFDQNLFERVQFTPYYPQDRENDKEVDATVIFDHSYSGHYKVKIFSCSDWNNCPDTIYESDLGIVSTDLHNLDVRQMHMTFNLIPFHDYDHQGAVVEFGVDYNNQTGQKYLPFKDFLVELVGLNDKNHKFHARTRWNRVEFRNCTGDSDDNDGCLHDLNADNYTVSVTPIDSRCNIRDVSAYLEPLPATKSMMTTICKRYADHPLEILDPNEMRMDDDKPWGHLEDILVGTLSALLAVVIILGVVFYFKREKIVGYCHHHKRRPGHLLANPSVMMETDGFFASRLRSARHQVLLIYSKAGSDEDGRLVPEKATILRQMLLAEGVVSRVYDFCADDVDLHRGPEDESSYWFTARIHDPAVRILVILSNGLATSPVMNALADRTSSSSLNRRLFVVTFPDVELSSSSDAQLRRFVHQFQLPSQFDRLVHELMKS